LEARLTANRFAVRGIRDRMQKYRKKPVVIEAQQFFPDVTPWPPGVVAASLERSRTGYAIATLEGPHEVTPGDYIIRGIKGELYPCKPDIFAATYERTDDACEELRARIEGAIDKAGRK
jgi:hypothetical protein